MADIYGAKYRGHADEMPERRLLHKTKLYMPMMRDVRKTKQ